MVARSREVLAVWPFIERFESADAWDLAPVAVRGGVVRAEVAREPGHGVGKAFDLSGPPGWGPPAPAVARRI